MNVGKAGIVLWLGLEELMGSLTSDVFVPSEVGVMAHSVLHPPQAELWGGQAGAGAARVSCSAVSQCGQNTGAAPHYCLAVGRNKPDSKNWHSFLGTSGGSQNTTIPFLRPLIFGFSAFVQERLDVTNFLGSPRLNVYNL